MAPALLSRAFYRGIVRDDGGAAIQTNQQQPLSSAQTEATRIGHNPTQHTTEAHAHSAVVTSPPVPISIAPASAPSSLLPPVAPRKHADQQHYIVHGTSSISIDDVPEPAFLREATYSIAYTYNIPRTALEQLLSTEGTDSFVAISSSEALTIAPDWRAAHSTEHAEWRLRAGAWKKMPVVAPVMGIVLLWIVVTWVGRRTQRAGLRRGCDDEQNGDKGSLGLD